MTDPHLDRLLSDVMQRDELIRLLVEAAVAAERDTCAKIAWSNHAYGTAAAIRARGES